MSRSFSTYLDLLRLMAALAVFMSHAALPEFTDGTISPPDDMGHKAVILFFLLSGYVIAYVAQQRERTLSTFAVSRMARIYSVAVPALALSFVVQLVLWHLGQHVPLYQLVDPMKYVPLFLTFMGDSWFLREDAFANLPYWSLYYEVWYYVAFASAVYLRGWVRLVALAVVVLATGPRIWLLAPLWAAGGLVWRLHRGPGPGRWPARLLFVASLAVAWFVVVQNPNGAINAWANRLSGGWMAANLRYSQFVVGDLLTGSVVAINLYAARYADLRFGPAARPLAVAASFTFALYLMHFPLLQLYSALGVPVPLLIPAVLVSVLLLGQVTERQKHRLRAWLTARLPPLVDDWRYVGRTG